MSEATITHLPDPSGFSTDPLTDLVRDGARQLIRQAVEAELAALLERHATEKLDDGRVRLVRHGYEPPRVYRRVKHSKDEPYNEAWVIG